MYVRRVKRKCGIRGCKNTDSFAVSRAREPGNTVIICRDCLKDALEAVEALPQGAKSNTPGKQPTEAPPLFFGDVLYPKRDGKSFRAPEKTGAADENKIKKAGKENEQRTKKKNA